MSVMNGLIKQLFTSNSPVARLSEHKISEKGLLVCVRIQVVLQRFCFNFHKLNKCHYLLMSVVNGGSRACLAHAPFGTQFFHLHTCPPNGSTHPHEKSWIRHWSLLYHCSLKSKTTRSVKIHVLWYFPRMLMGI